MKLWLMGRRGLAASVIGPVGFSWQPLPFVISIDISRP